MNWRIRGFFFFDVTNRLVIKIDEMPLRGGPAKKFHEVGIGPLSKIMAVKWVGQKKSKIMLP